MDRRALIVSFLGFLFWCSLAWASEVQVFKTELLEKLQANFVKVKTLTCRFEQVRRVRFLKQPLKFKGRLWVIPPNKIRIAYEKPVPSVNIFNQGEFIRCFGTQKERFVFKGQPWFKKLNQQIMSFMTGSYTTLESEYRIELLSNRGLAFYPRDEHLAQKLRVIRVWWDQANFWPKRVLVEKGPKDYLEITLKQCQSNLKLEATLFSTCETRLK